VLVVLLVYVQSCGQWCVHVERPGMILEDCRADGGGQGLRCALGRITVGEGEGHRPLVYDVGASGG
jgi:hypothetical protein